MNNDSNASLVRNHDAFDDQTHPFLDETSHKHADELARETNRRQAVAAELQSSHVAELSTLRTDFEKELELRRAEYHEKMAIQMLRNVMSKKLLEKEKRRHGIEMERLMDTMNTEASMFKAKIAGLEDKLSVLWVQHENLAHDKTRLIDFIQKQHDSFYTNVDRASNHVLSSLGRFVSDFELTISGKFKHVEIVEKRIISIKESMQTLQAQNNSLLFQLKQEIQAKAMISSELADAEKR